MSASNDYWECETCTFINKVGEGCCKACHGPAPTSSHSVPHSSSSLPTPIPPPQQHYTAPQQQYYTAPQQYYTAPSQQHYTAQQPPSPSSRMKMVRVQIPSGMKPGQQLRVLTDSTGKESVVVAIPKRKKWKKQNGKPYFDIQVPDKQPPPQTPIIVQGTYVNNSSNGPATNRPTTTTTTTTTSRPSTLHYSSNATYSHPTAAVNNTIMEPNAPRPAEWIPWEQFQGHSYQPPPLGVHSVSSIPISNLSFIKASGRRRAVLIGINYKGTRAALRGCVNDANQMEQLLVRHGFPNDSRHLVKLVDEQPKGRNYLPTRDNIIKACQWLVQGAAIGDVLFFHFSGHGAQVPDKTGHEADGYNETILPMDYSRAGQITDDTLWGTLVYPLPAGVRLTAVMDCCHSGTGLDLPYECNISTNKWKEDVNPAHAQCDAILFSGCEDSQTSADTFDRFQAGGAMTQSFIRAYNENPMALYPDFMSAIHRHLRKRGFKQRPQLTASQPFDVRSRVFSFVDGIEPNHNAQVGRIKRRHVHPAKQGYRQNNMNDLLFSAGGAMALAGLAGLFLGD